MLMYLMFSLPLFLDMELGISTIPYLAQQLIGQQLVETRTPDWWNDCKTVLVRSSMRSMPKAPDPTPSGLPHSLEEQLRSFVPTETAIDGGLYPDHIGDGMFGFDYATFSLAGVRAELPEVDPKRAEEIERRFAKGIPDRRPFPPKK